MHIALLLNNMALLRKYFLEQQTSIKDAKSFQHGSKLLDGWVKLVLQLGGWVEKQYNF